MDPSDFAHLKKPHWKAGAKPEEIETVTRLEMRIAELVTKIRPLQDDLRKLRHREREVKNRGYCRSAYQRGIVKSKWRDAR